jgi:hypothetical protein
VGAVPREPRKKTAVIWRGCFPSGSFRASRSAHVPTSAPSRRYGHSAPVKEFVKQSFGGPPFSFLASARYGVARETPTASHTSEIGVSLSRMSFETSEIFF